jgi:hypothetical protein
MSAKDLDRGLHVERDINPTSHVREGADRRWDLGSKGFRSFTKLIFPVVDIEPESLRVGNLKLAERDAL